MDSTRKRKLIGCARIIDGMRFVLDNMHYLPIIQYKIINCCEN
jgi:hypothetical protein